MTISSHIASSTTTDLQTTCLHVHVERNRQQISPRMVHNQPARLWAELALAGRRYSLKSKVRSYLTMQTNKITSLYADDIINLPDSVLILAFNSSCCKSDAAKSGEPRSPVSRARGQGKRWRQLRVFPFLCWLRSLCDQNFSVIHYPWPPGEVLRFGLNGGVPLNPWNPYPLIKVIWGVFSSK